ncbi:DUF7311 family protein [Halorussus litoreus]|uniref:DUF7311 family protein n=1 Tax=Halorussus litoreus TaxID=1710536 RepID=UPI000E286DF1|nr:hypothetical protein [Halorussus litoreus]
MLRVVLGLALAAAIVAAVMPALDEARTTRTDRLVARELDRVESAARALVREESPGARRTVEIAVPGESPTTAPVAFVSLAGLPAGSEGRVDVDNDDRDLLAYRLAGGSVNVRRVAVDLRVALDGAGGVPDGETIESDDRALVLPGGESSLVTLRLVRAGGRPVVVASARSASVQNESAASGLGKPPPFMVGW